MPEPDFAYRIWQRGSEWYWQVLLEGKHVLASGMATTSVAARKAAMGFCLAEGESDSKKIGD